MCARDYESDLRHISHFEIFKSLRLNELKNIFIV